MTSRWSLAISVSVLYAGTIAWTAPSKPLHAIVTSPAGRAGYLGRAVMWTDPGVISPIDLRNGPPGLFPYTFDEATAETGIGCAFDKPGKELGGKSAKFTCRAPGDHTLRLNYWDREHESGNREAFAMVAATRLDVGARLRRGPRAADERAMPGLPADPHTGSGPRALRDTLRCGSFRSPVHPSSRARMTIRAGSGRNWTTRSTSCRPVRSENGSERSSTPSRSSACWFSTATGRPSSRPMWCMDDVDLSAGEVRAEGKNGGHRVLVEHAAHRHAVAPRQRSSMPARPSAARGRRRTAPAAKMDLGGRAEKAGLRGSR